MDRTPRIRTNQIIVRQVLVDVPREGQNLGTAEEPLMAEDSELGLAAVAEFPDLFINPLRYTGVTHTILPTEFKGQYVVVQLLSVVSDEQLAEIEKIAAEHMAQQLEQLGEGEAL
jgi:hypothetical protein